MPTRETLAIDVDQVITSEQVVKTMKRVALTRGAPRTNRVDNGPAFVSKTMDAMDCKYATVSGHLPPISHLFTPSVTVGFCPSSRILMDLKLLPVSVKQAARFRREHHRHYAPPTGHKLNVGAADGDEFVGVAIVGRPVARRRSDGFRLEVVRLCAVGTKVTRSILYGAVARAVFPIGYLRICTYTLKFDPARL